MKNRKKETNFRFPQCFALMHIYIQPEISSSLERTKSVYLLKDSKEDKEIFTLSK